MWGLGGSERERERERQPVISLFELRFSEFGSSVGNQAAAIFSAIDSFALPRPVQWISGPGGLAPDSQPWSAVAPAYDFVDEV